MFLSDVNLGLFRCYSVTQRENLVLALKNAFSNSDWLSLVISDSGYYLSTVNQPLPSRQRVQHDVNTPFQMQQKEIANFQKCTFVCICDGLTDMHTLPGKKYKNGIFTS